jgi:hypothetical protein
MACDFRKNTYVIQKWKPFVSISGVCGWGFFDIRKRRHVAARRPYVANQFSEYKGSPTLRILDPRPVHDGQPARQGFASRALQIRRGRTGKLPGRGPEGSCRARRARTPSVGVRARRPWQGFVGRGGRLRKSSEANNGVCRHHFFCSEILHAFLCASVAIPAPPASLPSSQVRISSRALLGSPGSQKKCGGSMRVHCGVLLGACGDLGSPQVPNPGSPDGIGRVFFGS